jgi:hypothetical protein
MAGDWIKLRTNLPGDPAVIAMARALREDAFTIVGRLHALWAWADQHTDDGDLPYTVLADIDDVVKKRGFAQQMLRVGWLESRGEEPGVIIPMWDRHNGRSAKKRCLDSEAQRRKRETHTDINRTMSESHSDKTRPEPDQRREEKSYTPIVPASGDEPGEKNEEQTSEEPQAIADRNRALARAKALFRMRPGTPLDPAETRAWGKMSAIVAATADDDWLRLEKYYAADLPDKNNFRRRTLATLLNNWSGEHIAAADYCGRIGWRPGKSEKKEKGVPPEGEWRDVLQVLREEKNPAVADIDPRTVRSWSQLPPAAQTAIWEAIAVAEKEAA